MERFKNDHAHFIQAPGTGFGRAAMFQSLQQMLYGRIRGLFYGSALSETPMAEQTLINTDFERRKGEPG